MGGKLDLRGRKIGRLLVIGESTERKNGSVMWKCQCDCGNVVYVKSSYLVRNSVKSCGCLGTSNVDLTGKSFGKMKVLSATKKRKQNSIVWECQCEYCGNHKELSTGNLKNPTLDGCGCQRTKHIKEVNKLYQGTSIRQISSKNNRKNNTSGVKGVYKHKKNGKYVAYITLRHKQYYLGSYDTLEEATIARKTAEDGMFEPVIESYKKKGKDERI